MVGHMSHMLDGWMLSSPSLQLEAKVAGSIVTDYGLMVVLSTHPFLSCITSAPHSIIYYSPEPQKSGSGICRSMSTMTMFKAGVGCPGSWWSEPGFGCHPSLSSLM
jgi:hypothetical protein